MRHRAEQKYKKLLAVALGEHAALERMKNACLQLREFIMRI